MERGWDCESWPPFRVNERTADTITTTDTTCFSPAVAEPPVTGTPRLTHGSMVRILIHKHLPELDCHDPHMHTKTGTTTRTTRAGKSNFQSHGFLSALWAGDLNECQRRFRKRIACCPASRSVTRLFLSLSPSSDGPTDRRPHSLVHQRGTQLHGTVGEKERRLDHREDMWPWIVSRDSRGLNTPSMNPVNGVSSSFSHS